MTRLEQAIEKLRHLPKKDQNLLVATVLDEATWNDTFGATTAQIDRLGEQVLARIKAGEFKKVSC